MTCARAFEPVWTHVGGFFQGSHWALAWKLHARSGHRAPELCPAHVSRLPISPRRKRACEVTQAGRPYVSKGLSDKEYVLVIHNQLHAIVASLWTGTGQRAWARSRKTVACSWLCYVPK